MEMGLGVLWSKYLHSMSGIDDEHDNIDWSQFDWHARWRFRAQVIDFFEYEVDIGKHRYVRKHAVVLKQGVLVGYDLDVFDRLYLNAGKWSEGFEEGDVVEFDARIAWKTYNRHSTNYPLNYGPYWKGGNRYLTLERPAKSVCVEKTPVQSELEKIALSTYWHSGFGPEADEQRAELHDALMKAGG